MTVRLNNNRAYVVKLDDLYDTLDLKIGYVPASGTLDVKIEDAERSNSLAAAVTAGHISYVESLMTTDERDRLARDASTKVVAINNLGIGASSTINHLLNQQWPSVQVSVYSAAGTAGGYWRMATEVEAGITFTDANNVTITNGVGAIRNFRVTIQRA